MQEMHPWDLTPEEAEQRGKMLKQLFTGSTDEEVQQKMEKRAERLQRKGLVLHRRQPITDLPLAIRDLAAECASASNRNQRRRLKKELRKMVDAL
jgi:hypothetical protein